MVLFIVSALIAVIALGVSIKIAADFIKNVIPPVPFKKVMQRLLILSGVFAIGFTVMMGSIYLWAKIHPQPYELATSIIGSLLVSTLGYISLFSFLFHYYGKGKDKGITENIDKWMFRTLMAAFPLFIISIFILTEGYAYYCHYPLVNGISFTKGFVTPASGGSPNLALYALCILSGAIYVYFLCDHKFYLQYGKHGILESTFIVAFPAGIIGARLFYVIGNWNVEFAGREWWSVFAIWEGGLTILGGAITGIVVGVAWFLWRNKGYNIWLAVDIIVPTILIAQAVGRWGNFFNCEVHGVLMSGEYWKWLPRFIYFNSEYSSVSGYAPAGQIYVPLFFIECISNLLGYFVLAHLFGVRLRKYTQLGDLAFGYVMWYGMTRVIMEPLRDTAFNMGDDGYWSWIWSLVFVIGGALAIAINHLIRFLISKKNVTNKLPYIIGTGVVGVISIGGIVAAILMMVNSSFAIKLALNQFNNGLIVLALAISLLFGLLITVPPLIIKKKVEQPIDA